MPPVSYSQHGEDILLSRLFPEETSGFYIDIGANDPAFCSVTKHFYDRGWSGINVEPVPHLHARLARARPRDLNLNMGVSNTSGTLTFFESPAIAGWSTFSPPLAAHYRRRGVHLIERPIPVTTLTDLFERHACRPVDFLKIDVEGHEREVIEGIDWSRCRPRVLVVEDACADLWAHLIPESDYLLLYGDAFNRYYVRRDEPALLASWQATGDLPGSFVQSRTTHRLQRLLADLSTRDDLGPVARGFRGVLSRSLRMTAHLRRWSRRAG